MLPMCIPVIQHHNHNTMSKYVKGIAGAKATMTTPTNHEAELEPGQPQPEQTQAQKRDI